MSDVEAATSDRTGLPRLPASPFQRAVPITPVDQTGACGNAIWDYPFVAGMMTLSDDVRSVFDTAGFAKYTVNLHNLISYAAVSGNFYQIWVNLPDTSTSIEFQVELYPSGLGVFDELRKLFVAGNSNRI